MTAEIDFAVTIELLQAVLLILKIFILYFVDFIEWKPKIVKSLIISFNLDNHQIFKKFIVKNS